MNDATKSRAERVDSIFSAWVPKATRFLDELSTLYAPDCTHVGPFVTNRGPDILNLLFRPLTDHARSLRCVMHSVHDVGDECFASWTLEVTLPPFPLVRIKGASVLRFTGEQVSYQRDYYDLMSSAAKALPGSKWLVNRLLRYRRTPSTDSGESIPGSLENRGRGVINPRS